MTKSEAIAWYKEIISGEGVDRNAALTVVRRGTAAVRVWNDGVFTLGVEYGVLIALVHAFSITREDLDRHEGTKHSQSWRHGDDQA